MSFRKDVLAHFIVAQSNPLAPGTFRGNGAALHEGNVLPFHRVRLQLVYQVLTSRWIHGDAKDAAGVLIETMNRQRLEVAIDRGQ